MLIKPSTTEGIYEEGESLLLGISRVLYRVVYMGNSVDGIERNATLQFLLVFIVTYLIGARKNRLAEYLVITVFPPLRSSSWMVMR